VRILRGLAVALLVLVAVLVLAYAILIRGHFPDEPALSGSLERSELEWQGRTRSYHVYRPAAVREQPPLVLVLHASMGDGLGMRRFTAYGFDLLADREGFLVAYPDGFERHWNGCREAGPYSANELDVDDVGFLAALVEVLAARDGVGRDAVFATGISNGGHMALRLALERPELVAAVAPVAASLPTPDNMDCGTAGQPVAVMLLNGSEDPISPYEGGEVSFFGLGSRGEVISSQQTAGFFALVAGYAGEAEREQLPDRDLRDGSVVEKQIWRSPDRPEVAHYTVEGGGHTWPHPQLAFPRLLGRTNHDLDASEEMWRFFQRQVDREPDR